MHQTRENLDFLFRRLSPERLLGFIKSGNMTCDDTVAPRGMKEFLEQTYEHFAPLNMSEYSFDEIELRRKSFLGEMDTRKNAGVFAPLIGYAEKVLDLQNQEPVCKLDEMLNWNSITKRLGQDIFISCWLAWNDYKRNVMGSWLFTWPAVIRSDDRYLRHILKKGLAENHFHLNGSTQVFSVSWACLMNHPGQINRIVKEKAFNRNLTISMSRGEMDNMLSLHDRLLYAVMIRLYLSSRIVNLMTSEQVCSKFLEFEPSISMDEIAGTVEAFRQCYGEKFLQPNGSGKCLDYAISSWFCNIDANSANRLLVGERSFLYRCFLMHFEGKLTILESSLLHLYLLIKHNFAGELLQNNGLYGFHNFAEYQDRKSMSIRGRDEYSVEAHRLAVLSQVQDNNLLSLEARVMPDKKMRRYISELDSVIQWASVQKEEWEHYYVIHFPKKKFTEEDIPDDSAYPVPRNARVRRDAKKYALALKDYLLSYEMAMSCGDGRQRVFGIDGCSKEIGCGPETFATEFRYLRECSMHSEDLQWWQSKREDYVAIGITYHAGEDFLDIIDGLRSIDETIEFLQLKRGDRIGHAVALGVVAKDFYGLKRYNIYLTKQHYLDNLVWMLNRSLEWNIPLSEGLRTVLTQKAKELMRYIFWNNSSDKNYHEDLLDDYFCSWKLREDHPEIYFTEEPSLPSGSCWDEYDAYKIRKDNIELMQYRKIKSITDLVRLYHYDNGVKSRGLKPEQMSVNDWKSYAELVTQFQDSLKRKIAERGIAVECNLTSNVLIGTFRRYDAHPILRFNRHRLDSDTERVNILASLNTDDLGVFSTSLENEYALLLCALRKARHMAGKWDDTIIYDYLDYLRECGINMSFCQCLDAARVCPSVRS